MKKDNFEDFSPFLKDLKGKGEAQRVPDAYFEGLETAIFDKIKQNGLDRPASAQMMRATRGGRFNRVWIGVAAAAMVLLVSAVWFLKFSNTDQTPATYAAIELSEEDMENYLFDHVQDFEIETLSAVSADLDQPELPEGSPKKERRKSIDLKAEDIESVLDQMSDEELEDLL